MNIVKSYFAKTDHGPALELNEDEFDVDLINNLYTVIDGFGGVGIGDKVAAKIKDLLKIFYTKVSTDPNLTMPFYYSHKYLLEANALINAFHLAHKEIYKANEPLELSIRGGASVVSFAISDSLGTFVSVGNMAVFTYRKGELKLIIAPDSFESISKDNFRPYYLSLPMSGIGLFEDLHLQVKEFRYQQDDIVIMLSDGIYNRLTFDEIKFIIEKKTPGLREKVANLCDLSNSRGNFDNQTALLLQF